MPDPASRAYLKNETTTNAVCGRRPVLTLNRATPVFNFSRRRMHPSPGQRLTVTRERRARAADRRT
ncbi:unnamed protein product [Penicillium camemberti]|uniref:Str. FM013 n=1 Tax=Penicillium camemberti (strain FM 013) TaxID=1429867 RepID=A0A0G4P0C3_PENC3|nr:unnamed protein product [Penicillium camemberti]